MFTDFYRLKYWWKPFVYLCLYNCNIKYIPANVRFSLGLLKMKRRFNNFELFDFGFVQMVGSVFLLREEEDRESADWWHNWWGCWRWCWLHHHTPSNIVALLVILEANAKAYNIVIFEFFWNEDGAREQQRNEIESRSWTNITEESFCTGWTIIIHTLVSYNLYTSSFILWS